MTPRWGCRATISAKCRSRAFLYFTGVVNGAENGGLGTSNGGSYGIDTLQTIDASLTQQYHTHTFKYGFEHLIQQQGGGGLGASAGSFSFGSATNTSSDSWTCLNPVSSCTSSVGNGSNIAQFLLGMPLSGSIGVNATAFWSQHYTAAYFQDDWRVSSTLTLDLGLRWDYHTGVSDRKSTRLNSSHLGISYAVFCLK